MAAVNHSKVLALFDAVLLALKGTFSPDEVREVLDFVEVDEYGVALETLVDIVIEEHKSVSPDAIRVIQELGNELSMGGILQKKSLGLAVSLPDLVRPAADEQ